ncbi:DUF547 domain-containing protein [Kordiimonas aestuarii]|uniref:DUF547 domain-containing protein n=1 Tax=Kordiimonas aestuarii TaxID=1005925 RepID=UPI0021D177E6|nr:DUF547 domain-containing protein [Kordiimonas aestuarii]
MKKLLTSVMVMICAFCAAIASNAGAVGAADDGPGAAAPGHLPYHINYDDLTAVLENTVLITGLSNRERAPDIKASLGSRMKAKRNVYTAYEGNRIWLEALEEEGVLVVLAMIRKSLERVPDDVPITSFSTAEQIAYWLNLHNVALLEELVQHSQNNMKRLLYGRDGMMNKKLVTVQGVPLSLNDIRFEIVARRWPSDPLIIYGFYEGVIGGPNIRKEAFTGEKLHTQLNANAFEFINSNRGTSLKAGKTARVSSLYERYAMFFPDFQKDLKAHLLAYLQPGPVRDKVEKARRLAPEVDDWSVASLRGNTRDYGGASQKNSSALATVRIAGSTNAAMNSSMLADSLASTVRNFSRFSLEQEQLLLQLNKQRMARTGNVRIEELQEIKERVEKNE